MKKIIAVFLVISVTVTTFVACSSHSDKQDKKVLLNVAYDVIRDFYKEYNTAFRQQHPQITISQSHGGASKQALSVASGLPADVVTLTQANDIDMLVEKGLIAANWRSALPDNATPFGSVMVFLVRKGNPKNIRDWADLARHDVSTIFANPKTSANGRYAYLAALAYARQRFGDERQVHGFIEKMLRNIPVLEAGARGATISFTRRNLGDVLIAPENEAALAVQTLGRDDFELVYPGLTAYTPVLVAEVNQNSKINGTREQVQAYLRGLWSAEAQQLAAKNHFRPSDKKILKNLTALFPEIETFDVNEKFGDWTTINRMHFADNALFDRLYIQAQQNAQQQKGTN
ncbi:sulfate ABC transporter substrate-binding protein [Actinobacillus succinogenes]|uniref:Sulfate ABC transporter, periplasmic sulfate-binding protein n=1 Tax=Actinobacillus succinogenes (strain ATCC 55618 / DSM 22257 / CCUG 43843 / 130Z) TaxID=339671 RepID=A6VPZ7_ACTSZ|nr:sulfate ABC transporter substrate-binding protein [Actinobacillus succinogenes]ABR75044.1 sulfate ABC transporter, periplasmic sulfate-binding protein [Actinobacillus succinogenes 130Z]PHI40550.1 sulfate ABC transporter substrate-binding protein [Actinobacillus succinogenes]